MAFQNRYNSYDKMKDFDFSQKNGDFFSSERLQVVVSEDEDNYYIRALIAGLGSEDFSLHFKDNQLEIEAQFSSPSGKYLVQERAIGKFVRQINFSSCIDKENIFSEFANGLLYIELPKIEDSEISIESHEIIQDEKLEIEENHEKE